MTTYALADLINLCSIAFVLYVYVYLSFVTSYQLNIKSPTKVTT